MQRSGMVRSYLGKILHSAHPSNIQVQIKWCTCSPYSSHGLSQIWLEPVYRQAEKEWKAFIDAFTDRIVEADPQIPPLPPKDVIHRIYRDVSKPGISEPRMLITFHPRSGLATTRPPIRRTSPRLSPGAAGKEFSPIVRHVYFPYSFGLIILQIICQ